MKLPCIHGILFFILVMAGISVARHWCFSLPLWKFSFPSLHSRVKELEEECCGVAQINTALQSELTELKVRNDIFEKVGFIPKFSVYCSFLRFLTPLPFCKYFY